MATKIGIHHRLFCGDNFTSKYFKNCSWLVTKKQLIGVTVDNKFSFEPHLNLLCKKVRQKLHTLARISKKVISKKNLRVIMKAFVMSQFSYCTLVWMCYKAKY